MELSRCNGKIGHEKSLFWSAQSKEENDMIVLRPEALALNYDHP